MTRALLLKLIALLTAMAVVVAVALRVGSFNWLRSGFGTGNNRPGTTHTADPIRFRDVTRAAAIEFKHVDGRTDMHYVMEVMGAGVGWIDYDHDGLLDLFLVQGATIVPPHSTSPQASKLFRNLGGGRFEDVTAKVGLGHVGCGMGVAVGDIDNDGYPDLFLTCYGKPNVLYHNVSDGNGGRRFEDITARAGIGSHPDWTTRPNFSTSAAFLDYNADGLLDLFVCSYVKVDLKNYPKCFDPSQPDRRDICRPTAFAPTTCVLYRNNGNGTFTDVSKEAGIAVPQAKALGVAALDLDDDGLIDIFVANDGVPNFLFRNLGGGRFQALGASCGALVNVEGLPQAYMGVDADDVDDDLLPDIFSTAFSQESNTLFRNEGSCRFLDITKITGLGPPSWLMLGFGTCFLDVDNDSRLDLFVANGHVSRHVDGQGDHSLTFRQTAQLFRNKGGARFEELTSRSGPYFQERHVGRGAAMGDFDNDGRIDVAVSNNGDEALLLRNESETGHHWIRLELEGSPNRPAAGGRKSTRDAVGAKVTLDLGAGRNLVRHRKGGTSYLSAADPRLLVGLGDASRVEQLEIRWPSGRVQHVGPLDADHGYRIVEGESKVAQRP